MIRSFLTAFLVIFVLIPTIQAADNPGHSELLSKHYRLEKPVGPGPFPAVMMVSACSGFESELFKKHYDAVQSKLVKLGFVTLRVNYLAVRNATDCWKVSVEEVAGDICVAVDYLRQQTFVKKGAINVIGWSFGGSGALQALKRFDSRNPVQVNAVVAYYPECGVFHPPWDSEVPVLVLVGRMDNLTPLKDCNNLFRGLPSDRVTIRVYDDAHHCFDNDGLPVETLYYSGTIGYNEAAAKSAWLEVTKFLRK